MKYLIHSLVVLIAITMTANSFGQTQEKQSTETKQAESAQTETKSQIPAALNFKMKSLDDKEVNFADYLGNVVVFVNVASKCGMTPQYKQLQALHEKYGDQGLKIVGIPCNQFGGQEPGTADEIKSFCEKNYGVSFDMMAKVDVNGDEQCELYKYLNSLDIKPKGQGDIQWNFEKFVLDRKGNPIARFSPRTKPDADEFIQVIETALNQK